MALLGLLLLGISSAHAQLIWDWSYTTTAEGSDIYSGMGTLTTTATPVDGAYTIIGMTGTWNVSSGEVPDSLVGSYTITSLLPPGTDVTGFGYPSDNLLNTSGLLLTDTGFAFSDSSGDENSIYSLVGSYQVSTETGEDGAGVFTATQETASIPEPSSISLLAIALVLLTLNAGFRHQRWREPR